MYYVNPYSDEFNSQEQAWLNEVGALFDRHWSGEEKFDPYAWINDYRKGLTPSEAFYNEYPEVRERMRNYDEDDYKSFKRSREEDY